MIRLLAMSPRYRAFRLGLSTLLLLIALLPFVRRASVTRISTARQAAEITLSPNRIPADLAAGCIRIRIKNLGQRPVSLLARGYPATAMSLPSEAINHSEAIDPMYLLWSKKDFVVIQPMQTAGNLVDVFQDLNPHTTLFSVGTFTGQISYYGDDLNDESKIFHVTGHSDLGTIYGPMVTVRHGWLGNTVLL